MYEVFEQLLQKNNISAYKVSKEANVTQTMLSNWKKGKSIPSAQNLKKIADYFNVSVDYLMTGREQTEEEKLPEEKFDKETLAFAKELLKSDVTLEELRVYIDAVKQIKKNK